MKLLLAAVNAKYIHTNLALRYLSKSTEDICPSLIKEYSINDSILSVERDIVLLNPDIICFSCYIWNISFILTLCENIKKSIPDCVIIFGGPEVSYDAPCLIHQHEYIDYIIKGEGEITFPLLLKSIVDKTELPNSGITYKNAGSVIDTSNATLPDFPAIPFPYDAASIKELDGRILYYETSRGCPYSCKYCLSGERGKVRFKNVELVKEDLKFFSDNKIPLVKFVDRTFNADKKRALEIWEYISSLNTDTRFHMEITGELLNDETIEALKNVNPQNLQFEIGVQSTNPETLSAIDRKCDVDKLFNNIKKLLDSTDIHVHLDLIAGLPYENFDSFKKSFNDVLSLKPHVLQLGFLKLLKGSAMREECEKHGIVYRSEAPYEIISNNYITSEELFFLRDVDYVFDKYYNSASFNKTMDFLFEKYDDKFDIFSDIVDFFRKNNYINTSLSKQKLYDILYECFSYYGAEFEEALRYDIIYNLHVGKLPYWCNTDNAFTSCNEVFEFLKNEEYKSLLCPHLCGVPAKSIIKHVRFEKFKNSILMFDYSKNMVYNVTDYINV